MKTNFHSYLSPTTWKTISTFSLSLMVLCHLIKAVSDEMSVTSKEFVGWLCNVTIAKLLPVLQMQHKFSEHFVRDIFAGLSQQVAASVVIKGSISCSKYLDHGPHSHFSDTDTEDIDTTVTLPGQIQIGENKD